MKHVEYKPDFFLTEEEKKHIMQCPECHHNWKMHRFALFKQMDNLKKISTFKADASDEIADNKTDFYRLYIEALSLVDGASVIVRLFNPETNGQKEWQKSWLDRANEMINKYDKKENE